MAEVRGGTQNRQERSEYYLPPEPEQDYDNDGLGSYIKRGHISCVLIYRYNFSPDTSLTFLLLITGILIKKHAPLPGELVHVIVPPKD